MTQSNTMARLSLALKYGNGCFFKRAKIAERIEKMGGIKTYKKYKKETKYTNAKIKKNEKELNFHHLVHKSEGGEATVENGAIINRMAHQYMHSLPREHEEIINDMLRDFKTELDMAMIVPNGQGLDMKEIRKNVFGFQNGYMDIPLFDNDEKTEYKRKHKYDKNKDSKYKKRIYFYNNNDDNDDKER